MRLLKFLKKVHSDLYLLIVRKKFGRKCIDIADSALFLRSASLLPYSGWESAIAIGEHSVIRGEFMTFGHGGKIQVGHHCFVGEGTRIWAAKSITIGNRVLISHQVNIFDNLTHPLSALERHMQYKAIIENGHPNNLKLDEQDVIIEDDSLICAGSIILRGVRIGRGAVVGAGAVVTRDVEPWNVVAGNPARVIRILDSESESASTGYCQ